MSRHEAVTRVQALKAFPGFRELPPEYLVALGDRARLVRWKADEALQTAGSVPGEMHIVLEGVVALNDGTTRLRTVEEYDLVGGPMSMSDQPAIYDAVALTEVEAIAVETPVARALIVDHIAIFSAVLRDLARGLRLLRRAAGSERGFAREKRASRPSCEVGVIECMRALVESPVFENAPVDIVGAIAAGAEVQRHAAGEIVAQHDERPEHALFPIYGEVACVRDGCGVVSSGGDGVGLEAMLAREAMGCTFKTTCDSAFVRVHRDTLFDDLEDDDDACTAVLIGLSNVARAVAASTLATATGYPPPPSRSF